MAETLTSMILQSRRRADMENSANFVSDDEITHMLNDSIANIYAQMVNIDDGSLFAIMCPEVVSLGNNSYQLPSDYMRLVDVNIHTGSRWVPAFPADPQAYLSLLTRSYNGDHDVRYFVRLNVEQDRYEVFLFPSKDVADIGVRYIQEAPELSVAGDTLNWPSNWHQPVVVDTAIKMLVKEESDPSGLIFEYERGLKRVLKDIRSQKVAEVKTIRDMGNRSKGRNPFYLPNSGGA
jgi:hypothetical protein